MLKSKKWHRVMLAVVSTDLLSPADKLELLEMLASEKNVAEMVEAHEVKKQEAAKKQEEEAKEQEGTENG